jgi:hypothetical protein
MAIRARHKLKKRKGFIITEVKNIITAVTITMPSCQQVRMQTACIHAVEGNTRNRAVLRGIYTFLSFYGANIYDTVKRFLFLVSSLRI